MADGETLPSLGSEAIDESIRHQSEQVGPEPPHLEFGRVHELADFIRH